MTSFSSLLSSISGQPQAPRPTKSPIANTPAQHILASESSKSLSNAASLAPDNAAAGVKRKAVGVDLEGSRPQVVRRLEPHGRSGSPVPLSTAPARTTISEPHRHAAYRGTAKPKISGSPAKVLSKPVPRPSTNATSAPAGAQPITSDGPASKPKRGFAALMEKAKASQAASTVAGSSGIKHKAAEKLSRREREKMQKEATLEQQKKARKNGGTSVTNRNGTGNALGAGVAQQTKAQESNYKGTMRKPGTELSYKGTMRAGGNVQANMKPVVKKGQGRDIYGGYASWSDLDDAEDEEDYDSEGSSDMEGGFDDVEREESAALRAARKEDQEALEEEERHRREKEERRRRLQALNKSAGARRRV